MHTFIGNQTPRAAIGAAVLAVLFGGSSMTLAQISGAAGTTTSSTCSGGGGTDGDCRFSRSFVSSSGTSFQSRYAWNINADVGISSTHDTSGTAVHNLSFNATAPGGYRLDVATTFVGDMNRSSDASGCDGASNISGVTGSSTPAASGTLNQADPGAISSGGGDSTVPFSQGPTAATIFKISNAVAQAHTLTFSWSGSVRSNSCEAAVRLGESSGSTSGCSACGYPGSPSRTQSSDGHFVTVSFTSLCGNGTVDASVSEQCDQGGANGSATSCCTSTCQFRSAGQTCRVGAGVGNFCDANETCSGTNGACPVDDAPGKAGVTCNAGSGDVCDQDELCTGTPGQGCPTDIFKPSSFTCRTGSGDVCDPSENCPGVANAACPSNVVNGPSTVCRLGSGDQCDTNETCSGVATAPCPPDDAPLNSGTVCRSGSGDACDANETCTGTPGQTCPADDAPSNTSIICRPSSESGH